MSLSIHLVGLVKGQRKIRLNYRFKAAGIDKTKIFAEALRHCDLDGIYIKPALRELLEKAPRASHYVTIKEESQV